MTGHGLGLLYGYSRASRAGATTAEVFVPLSHPSGEAQFDFGFATVKIAGVALKAACAVMCLP